mgnify:CR=1 FL=1
MNERIKELMVKAGIYECDDFEPHPTFEKFAELIVAECAKIVINNGIATATHDQMVRQDCVNDIKEHFGVEE